MPFVYYDRENRGGLSPSGNGGASRLEDSEDPLYRPRDAQVATSPPERESWASKRERRRESRKAKKAARVAAKRAAEAAALDAEYQKAMIAYYARLEASVIPPAAEAVPEPAPAPVPEPPPPEDDRYDDWGQATYLSNDDTMSLSSAQRVIFAIDKVLPVPLAHIRPHELLNYFSFETAAVQPTDDFSVLAEVAADPKQEGSYNLALAIRGRPVDKQARRNANLTFVVDRSGSMRDEGRMEYLKRGMRRMIGELKTGDLVNVVLFDHKVCVPLENFVVGRDDLSVLEKTIGRIKPRGATDVHAGLTRGYALADRAHQPTYNNRVVLVTDALANTGDTDARTMAMVAKFYDERKIRLSGVGVGTEFNDALLDALTERGKGAYVFLGSEAEVDAVFGRRFISLLETTALDVHFQLHLPPSLRMNVFYGEESSAIKEDVQAIHYFANTSQLFLSDLMARSGKLRPQDQIMLTIEYEDPETGAEMVEERAFTLGEITQEDAFNVRKGRLLIGWADRLAQLATRPAPAIHGVVAGIWDPDGWQVCDSGRMELAALAQGLSDPESARVLALWDKFCSRYERPSNPVGRDSPASAGAAGPSARGFSLYRTTSALMAHPTAKVEVPAGQKLIGGGCAANWSGSGQLLTASYPEGKAWVCASKDHQYGDPGTMTAFAIAAPASYDIKIVQATGPRAAHPITQSPALPPGYELVGGGCRVNWTDSGNLLTYSAPSDTNSQVWECRSKEHLVNSPATITAYAIGVARETTANTSWSVPTAHPTQSTPVAPGFRLAGGGCVVQWNGAGNLLTMSAPSEDLSAWRCKAKDHVQTSPAALGSVAIGVK